MMFKCDSITIIYIISFTKILNYFALTAKNRPEITHPLRKKFPYLEFLWSVFSRIRTEYAEIRSICPYSVRLWKNTDQKSSEYEHFSRTDSFFMIYPFRALTIYDMTEISWHPLKHKLHSFHKQDHF